MASETEWFELTRRNARSVQTTIGWIFWDPGAVRRYEALGLPGPLGYIAARIAPFGRAGYEAVVAALGSISPLGVRFVIDFVSPADFALWWNARNDAVRDGVTEYAPEAARALSDFRDDLWRVVGQLPFVGRPFSASHLEMERVDDPVLSGWHAVNVLREWRGDTHWGIIAQLELTAAEASTLHNEWLRYDGDWLSHSRGLSQETISEAWRRLETKGLAVDGVITEAGLELRQWIEDETDRRTTLPWRLLGWDRAVEFHQRFEPPCELLLQRVDITAGERYQPASRIRTTPGIS